MSRRLKVGDVCMIVDEHEDELHGHTPGEIVEIELISKFSDSCNYLSIQGHDYFYHDELEYFDHIRK